MEDGVKEDLAQSHEPTFLGKAGWLKKAHGRLLTSYKERYIHVERTELVVYDNEDLLNCLERLDLENYDKCHELKTPFTKKHRLILIRTPKPGNKVYDLKFQAVTAEEKDAWIKALTDGISRAKNKVFDEVKVDESSNLEHVTRTRPKGNRNRRPPTRIHMKEVAVLSCDGILRLDLDLENAVMPNGTHYANVDGTENSKEVPTCLFTVSEAVEELPEPQADKEAQNESQASPKKKIKPPMPPTKEAKPREALEDEPDKQDGAEKKVLKPPVPPSKEHKPSNSSTEDISEEAKTEKISEKIPDVKKKAGPPPTPPNKPTSQATPHPPTPPSKGKKPSHFVVDPGQGPVDENEEQEKDNKDETTSTAKETAQSISKEVCVRDDGISEEETGESLSKASHSEKLIHTEPLRWGSSPTNDEQDCTATASDTSGSSLQTEEELPKTEVPSVVVPSNDLFIDNVSLKAEEKSVDSGQHSDGDSEGSETEDTLAASTAALRGSQAALDVLDSSIQIPLDLSLAQVTEKQQVKVVPCQRIKPTLPLKPSTKVRSVSIGDLLSDFATCSTRAGGDDAMKLETEVAEEMEKTSALLSRVSQSQNGGDGKGMPEDLLTKAMEKLKMAENVLKEVKELKRAKNLNNRTSW